MFMMAFPHLHNLLSSLQKHLLAYCFTQQPWKPHTSPAAELLFKHTSLMFTVTKSLLDKALVLMQHENCNSSVIIAIEGQQKFAAFSDNAINNGNARTRLAVHIYNRILVFRISISQILCICQNNLIVPKIYPLPNQV